MSFAVLFSLTLVASTPATHANVAPTVASAGAAAAASEVGVLPPLVLGAADGDEQARMASELMRATEAVLGPRLRAMPLVASCDPAVESRCLADEIAKIAGVNVVAQLVVERGAHAWLLRLRTFGRDGQLVGEQRATTDDDDAARAAQDVLFKAFDPARRTGRVVVRGLPRGARASLDGTAADESTSTASDGLAFDAVAAGAHVVEVTADGGTRAYPIAVEFGRTTEVLAGPVAPVAPAASAPLPPLVQPIAVGGVVTGLVAASTSLLLWLTSVENRDEWHRRAIGRTFPRNNDDPRCAASECIADGAQSGWTQGYGPLGDDAQVGQGARFMMVAFSRDNELAWERANDAATWALVSSSLITVASSVTLVALAVIDDDEQPTAGDPRP